MIAAQAAHPRLCPAVAAPRLLAGAIEHQAIALSGICDASTRTRSTTSAAALQRCCPMRFFFTLSAEWSPPCQRITRSSAFSSTRTTISSIRVRTMRFFVSLATPGLFHARSRSAPGTSQSLPIDRAQPAGRGEPSVRFKLGLDGAHFRQPLVPSLLEFARDETVVGVDGVILASRPSGFVARLLERQLDLPALVPMSRDGALPERQAPPRERYLDRLETLQGRRVARGRVLT